MPQAQKTRTRLVTSQQEFNIATVIMAVLLYAASVYVMKDGNWVLVPVIMWLASPVAMKVLRWWFEENRLPLVFNRNGISKAFAIGDVLVLPFAFGFAAHGWTKLEYTAFFESWLTWGLFMGVIGFTVAVCFSRVDGPRYVNADHKTALLSPTKLWHDWAVMPVFVAMIFWLMIPQLVFGRSIDTWIALGLLALFIGLCVWDMISEPDVRQQHVLWDQDQFEPTDKLIDYA